MTKDANIALIRHLTEFGLSDKEARVYLALLQLEVATVTQIAKQADINRSSSYVVLSSLKKKGLVSAFEDTNVQQYAAISPEMLLVEANQTAKRAEHIKNNIDFIVPELKALHKDTKEKPKVRMFEGRQGLVNALEDTLTCKEKIIRMSSSIEQMLNILPEYFPTLSKRRAGLGIKIYGIYPDTAGRLRRRRIRQGRCSWCQCAEGRRACRWCRRWSWCR